MALSSNHVPDEISGPLNLWTGAYVARPKEDFEEQGKLLASSLCSTASGKTGQSDTKNIGNCDEKDRRREDCFFHQHCGIKTVKWMQCYMQPVKHDDYKRRCGQRHDRMAAMLRLDGGNKVATRLGAEDSRFDISQTGLGRGRGAKEVSSYSLSCHDMFRAALLWCYSKDMVPCLSFSPRT